MGTLEHVLLALDGMGTRQAFDMLGLLVGRVRGSKGNDLLDGDTAPKEVVGTCNAYGEFFSDIKVCDTPDTAANRIAKHARNGAAYISAHGSGGPKMLAKCVKAYNDNKPKDGKGILVISVLTSFDPQTCKKIYGRLPPDQVELFVQYAADAGAYGVVCAAAEIPVVKKHGLVAVVPGTRSIGQATHDQTRVDTPSNAIRAGADILVIGRQITGSPDPIAATDSLDVELRGGAIS